MAPIGLPDVGSDQFQSGQPDLGSDRFQSGLPILVSCWADGRAEVWPRSEPKVGSPLGATPKPSALNHRLAHSGPHFQTWSGPVRGHTVIATRVVSNNVYSPDTYHAVYKDIVSMYTVLIHIMLCTRT